MKRFLALVLCLLMTFSMFACTPQADPVPTPAQSTNPPPAPATTEDVTYPTTIDESLEPIKIGGTDYLTGALAAYLIWSRVGGYLAVEEINANGGIRGHRLELVKADIGGADTATAMLRMTELKEQGCVAITTTTTTNPAQWAAEEKIPTFVMNNYSTQLTIANYNDYLFFGGLNAWGIVKILALAAVGEEGHESFAYIGVDTDDTVDAENCFLLEGQKINPNFKKVASYRMDYNDDKYSTIVSTVMSQPEQPDMILQQGGGANFLGFVQQGNMYNMYDRYHAYSDLVVDASAVTALVQSGEYPYGNIHGTCFLRTWDTANAEVAAWVQAYKDLSREMNDGIELVPSGAALCQYLNIKTIAKALEHCIDNGLDYNDGDVLCDALTQVSWEDCFGEHLFRDFDHVLTFDGWYVTSTDGGEEFDHFPIGNADDICYGWEEWLPSLEDMKTYAAQMGYPDRFANYE